MQTVNVNQLVHSASPYFMGVGLQSWSVTAEPFATGVYSLGPVLSKPRKGFVSIDFRQNAKFAAGESLNLKIIAVRLDASAVTLVTRTIDDTFAAGAHDLLLGAVTNPQEGDVLHALATYTAGGGPAAPLSALLVQVG